MGMRHSDACMVELGPKKSSSIYACSAWSWHSRNNYFFEEVITGELVLVQLSLMLHFSTVIWHREMTGTRTGAVATGDGDLPHSFDT